MQARVLAGGLRTRGTRVVCGAQRSTLLVCGDRLGWAGSGSTVGDAAAACSALVFFLGGAFFAAGALRLGAILSSRLCGRLPALHALTQDFMFHPKLQSVSRAVCRRSLSPPVTLLVSLLER